MAVVQPYTVITAGGLDLVTSRYQLMSMPSVATELVNFEVDLQGGYRRINGFTRLGGDSATNPGAASDVLGVIPYGLGVLVCVDTGVYYTEDDGLTWLQVNKDTTGSGIVESLMPSTAALPRASQQQAQFTLFTAPVGRTTTTYGSLNIATGADSIARFRIEGTGPTRLFYYEEYTGVGPTGGTYIEEHQQHLCVVDTAVDPSTVYISATNDDSDFTGSGSNSVTIPDKITGIKSFRNVLYIFSEHSIYRLLSINDNVNIRVEQVSENLGCVSGYTIQEFGGDLIFLSSDGFRTIAGTERIDDVELSSLSRKIQPLVLNILAQREDLSFTSVVLKNKSQYRMFYAETAVATQAQKGIIGTLRTNPQTGQIAIEWSECIGIEATAIESENDERGVQVTYHGDQDGRIFVHDTGNTFNGLPVKYAYKTPDISFEDPGLRKTLHYMLLSVKPEGDTDIKLKVNYDFSSPLIVQPPLQDVGVINYSSLYGTAIYGTSTYGTSLDPIKRVNLRGSGTSASFKFSGEDSNPSFTINGYYITYVPSDRR